MYLEHANITVSNLDDGIHFFQTAFPEFEIRHMGTHLDYPWVHIGTDETYLALNQRDTVGHNRRPYAGLGVNHIGFVVDDVEAVAERLINNGYERDYPKQVEQFRIRDYFADKDGNQYEFVQYLSNVMSERNSYDA